jgi:hypothetical protein
MAATPLPVVRRVVSWVLLVAAVVVSVWSMVVAFTTGADQGEGWIAGPIEVLFMGVPLFLVGLGVRSDRREVARRTVVACAVLVVLVGFVLVMQLLDPNEVLEDRLVQVVGLVLYLSALVVDAPAFTDRWPPPPPDRASPWGWSTWHR